MWSIPGLHNPIGNKVWLLLVHPWPSHSTRVAHTIRHMVFTSQVQIPSAGCALFPGNPHTMLTLIKYHTRLTLLKYHTRLTLIKYHTRLARSNNHGFHGMTDCTLCLKLDVVYVQGWCTYVHLEVQTTTSVINTQHTGVVNVPQTNKTIVCWIKTIRVTAVHCGLVEYMN